MVKQKTSPVTKHPPSNSRAKLTPTSTVELPDGESFWPINDEVTCVSISTASGLDNSDRAADSRHGSNNSGLKPTFTLYLSNNDDSSVSSTSPLPSLDQSTTLQVPSPTDAQKVDVFGDPRLSTDEDDIPDNFCETHEHDGYLALDETFATNVDKLFESVFTDSDLYRDVIRARKTTDLVQSPWPVETNEDGTKQRKLTYVLALNYPLGPKVSPLTEIQTLCKLSRPGHCYMVDCECQNHGIPYEDCFYVLNRYCISRVSRNASRLRVHCQVKYRKKVWGLVKNFIEKNAMQGLSENFKVLGEFLHKEFSSEKEISGEKEHSLSAGEELRCGSSRLSKKIHSRRQYLRNQSKIPSTLNETTSTPVLSTLDGKAESVCQNEAASKHSEAEEFHFKVTLQTLLTFLFITLVVLILCNVMLCYKLSSVEQLAASVHQHRQRDTLGRSCLTKRVEVKTIEQWDKALEKQRNLYEIELDRWKEILASSIELISQMHRTLLTLQDGIEKEETKGSKETPSL